MAAATGEPDAEFHDRASVRRRTGFGRIWQAQKPFCLRKARDRRPFHREEHRSRDFRRFKKLVFLRQTCPSFALASETLLKRVCPLSGSRRAAPAVLRRRWFHDSLLRVPRGPGCLGRHLSARRRLDARRMKRLPSAFSFRGQQRGSRQRPTFDRLLARTLHGGGRSRARENSFDGKKPRSPRVPYASASRKRRSSPSRST